MKHIVVWVVIITTCNYPLEVQNLLITKQTVETAVPLKYLSNFSRTLDMLFINCEVPLILTWSENCLLTSKAYRRAVATQGGNPAVPEINNPTGATFKITDKKLHVPVVTLSAENDNENS